MWRFIWTCWNKTCGRANERVDWGKIWRETSAVTAEEWNAIKVQLRESYDRIKQLISETTEWPSEEHIGGVIAIIVHTAYHLGEIRQALCTLQAEEASVQ